MRKILWLLWFFSSHQRFHSIHNLATIFLGIFLNRPIARVPRWKRLTNRLTTEMPPKKIGNPPKVVLWVVSAISVRNTEILENLELLFIFFLRGGFLFIFLRHFLIYLRVSAFQLTNIFKEFPNIFEGFPNIFVEFRQNCWGVSVDFETLFSEVLIPFFSLGISLYFETLFTIFFWGVWAKFLRRSDTSKSLT